MKTVWVLLQKEISLFLRDKTAILLTFLVPFLVILIMGSIFSRMGDQGGLNANIKIAALNASGDPSGDAFIEALQSEEGLEVVTEVTNEAGEPTPFTEESIRAGIEDHHFNFALIVPEDFLKEDGIGVRIRFLSNPESDIEAQIVNGLMQKSLFTKLPDLLTGQLDDLQKDFMGEDKYTTYLDDMAAMISRHFDGFDYQTVRENVTLKGVSENFDSLFGGDGGEDSEGRAGAALFENIIEIEEDQVFGKEVKNPYLTRLIGGYAIMFLLFATTGSASSLFEERNEGLFLRLFSMPVRHTHILWSKYLFNTLLGIVQTITLFTASSLLFDVAVFSNIVNLFIVSVCCALTCTAFGMLLASVSKTPQQANGLGTLIIISMSAMGGAWFPLSMMPEIMQIFAKFTLVFWGVEAYLGTLWEGAPLVDLLPHLGVLLAMTVCLNAISAWRFKTSDLFR